MGATEIWRDLVKPAALREMQRYLPALRLGDVRRGPSGIRAQVMTKSGELVDDFLFAEGPRSLHVVNAPSHRAPPPRLRSGGTSPSAPPGSSTCEWRGRGWAVSMACRSHQLRKGLGSCRRSKGRPSQSSAAPASSARTSSISCSPSRSARDRRARQLRARDARATWRRAAATRASSFVEGSIARSAAPRPGDGGARLRRSTSPPCGCTSACIEPREAIDVNVVGTYNVIEAAPARERQARSSTRRRPRSTATRCARR